MTLTKEVKMSDEKPAAGAGEQNAPGSRPENVPYDRFSEVIEQKNAAAALAKDLQAKLDKIAADQEAARKAELEKQGEYKALLEEQKKALEAAQAKATAFDEYQAARREALTSRLPEEKRKYTASMDLQTLEEFVEDNAHQQAPAPGGGVPRPRGPVPQKRWSQMTKAERQQALDEANRRR